jgi:hypothetical protein
MSHIDIFSALNDRRFVAALTTNQQTKVLLTLSQFEEILSILLVVY